MPAQVQFEGKPVFDGGNALLIQAAGCRLDELAVDAVKRGTAPQPQRITVSRGGPVQMTGLLSRVGGGDKLPEPLGVQLPSADLDNVAVRPRGDHLCVAVRREEPPQ